MQRHAEVVPVARVIHFINYKPLLAPGHWITTVRPFGCRRKCHRKK
jgi:hypothetical protein